MALTADLEGLYLNMVVGHMKVGEYNDISYSVIILRSFGSLRMIMLPNARRRGRSVVRRFLDSNLCSVNGS